MKMFFKKYGLLVFVLFFAGMASFQLVFADEPDVSLLKGKWIFENVTAFENGVQIKPFSADSLKFEPPGEMDIQQEVLIFTRKEQTSKASLYSVIKGNTMCIPVCAEWKIVNNRLQLQWMQDVPVKQTMRTITISYKRK